MWGRASPTERRFNPLLIGARTGTRHTLALPERSERGFNPLLIGARTGTSCTARCFPTWARCFNPLLIGARTGTCPANGHRSWIGQQFQSPTNRG